MIIGKLLVLERLKTFFKITILDYMGIYTFKKSGTILLGPRDEKKATTGAEVSLRDSLFSMFALGFL